MWQDDIFDRYSQNLFSYLQLINRQLFLYDRAGNIQEFREGIYFCPLCQRPFLKALAFDQAQSVFLTKEDVPPKHCGGRPLLLTCKICNNDLGSDIDSHIEKQLSIEPFLSAKDNSSVPATLILDQYTLHSKGELIIRPSGHSFYFSVSKKSNPLFHDKLFKDLLPNRKAFTMQAKFKGASDLHFDLALIKSAYLMMYAYFGANYWMDTSADLFRKIILEREPHPFTFRGIIRDPFEGLKPGLYLLNDSNEAFAFLCLFELTLKKVKHTARFGVLLPGPGQEGQTNFSHFSTIEKMDGKTFRLALIKDNLVKENVLDGYHVAWATGAED
jgi:hypothetical protein